jgi:hypothetical protein
MDNDLMRENEIDRVNIKRVKDQAHQNLYKNKIMAYIDNNLSYNERAEVEAELGRNKELFAYYEEKKSFVEKVHSMIPEAPLKTTIREQLKVEIAMSAENMMDKSSEKKLVKRITSILNKKLW